jgi:dihydroorotate dehydrogenase electron transfer subunit
MSNTGFTINGVIEGNDPAVPGHFLLRIQLPPTFATPLPGQFVMVRKSEGMEPLLARPLSVFGFQRQSSHSLMELLYRVAGRGTSLLSRMKPGEQLAVLGPLGRGFTFPDKIKRVIFVAGGIGVAPLVYLLQSGIIAADSRRNIQKCFYLGARSSQLLAGLDRLEGLCRLGICTDDGSLGHHGTVTALLESETGGVKGYDPSDTLIYACGPLPMIRSLATLLTDHPIPCQVSLEERMACGLGACLGCAVAIRGSDGTREYQRVCKDGPVFDLSKVLL